MRLLSKNLKFSFEEKIVYTLGNINLSKVLTLSTVHRNTRRKLFLRSLSHGMLLSPI